MEAAGGEASEDEEDEPTLSLSNPDLCQVTSPPDEASGKEDISRPPVSAGEEVPGRKRSTSESARDRDPESRASRPARRSVSGRQQQKGFESTQSVDRCEKERSSPVFFLDPEDWFRSEGSVPTVNLTASKLLESSPPAVAATAVAAAVVRSESDENLDAELERISFLSETLRRTHSEIHCRSETCTPNFRSRSATPARGGWRPIREEPFSYDRTRKMAVPVLWRRGALRVGLFQQGFLHSTCTLYSPFSSCTEIFSASLGPNWTSFETNV
jgi:hypothetical protein